MSASLIWSPRLSSALAGSVMLLAATGAVAESPPAADPVSAAEIRRALIFTGHYNALQTGEPSTLLRNAGQSWQSANDLPITDTLPTEEVNALLSDGMKQRYAFGWAMMRDKSIGLDIGIPTKLVKFVDARPANSTLEYTFEGEIGYKLVVRYGEVNCGSMNALYAQWTGATRPAFAVRRDDWFAIATSGGSKVNYTKAICRPSAIAVATISVSTDQFAKQGVLLAAMADSFTLGRNFNSTAVPRPKIDEPPSRPADYKEGESPRPPKPVAKELPPNVDGTGKIAALKLAARTGAELRAEQVFEQAGAAVYMVKAGDRLGSAVAIGEYELLTNCHVVADMTRVTLSRDHNEIAASLVSKNVAGDRCVLRAEARLPKWVRARPYENIKVGERAFTIGTPRGFELTVAEGIVSSKRMMDDRRYIQTTAPISPGSSGGGLFDAEGHLLGITTFYRKDSQNLNFAIAADEYAK